MNSQVPQALEFYDRGVVFCNNVIKFLPTRYLSVRSILCQMPMFISSGRYVVENWLTKNTSSDLTERSPVI